MIKKGTVIAIENQECRVSYDDFNMSSGFIPVSLNIDASLIKIDAVVIVACFEETCTNGVVIGVIE